MIAPSFGDIFKSNASKMGLLTVELPEEEIEDLARHAEADPGSAIEVDLEAMSVVAGDLRASFDIDPFVRRCLLEGQDDIGLTLRHEGAIAAFEARRPEWMPDLRRFQAPNVNLLPTGADAL